MLYYKVIKERNYRAPKARAKIFDVLPKFKLNCGSGNVIIDAPQVSARQIWHCSLYGEGVKGQTTDDGRRFIFFV